MGNAQDVVDMLQAETKDEVVAAAVRWHAAWAHRRSVEDFERDFGLDESDSEQIDRIDRCRAIELEATENLAGKIEWALRYGHLVPDSR